MLHYQKRIDKEADVTIPRPQNSHGYTIGELSRFLDNEEFQRFLSTQPAGANHFEPSELARFLSIERGICVTFKDQPTTKGDMRL